MSDGSEKGSEVQNQWSAGFSNVRCKGIRKRVVNGITEARTCANLLYRVKTEGPATVVECRCKECKEYSIRKFRPRREEKCLTEQ